MNPTPRFLSVEDVLALHAITVEDQGGDRTLRDRGLLESAVGTPSQQFSGQYLHADIPALAAAYAFHISKNHPFVDGNKRTAFAAMYTFLAINDVRLTASAGETEDFLVNLYGTGSFDFEHLCRWLRGNASS